MSEQSGGEKTDFLAAAEARKAESRANIASAIWTGLKLGVSVLILEILWGRFLKHGGTQEELMSRQSDDSNQPPEIP